MSMNDIRHTIGLKRANSYHW